METELEREFLESLHHTQLKHSAQLLSATDRYEQDQVQKGEAKTCSNLQRLIPKHLGHKTRAQHTSARERLYERGTLAIPLQGKGAQRQDCNIWILEGHRSRGETCSFKHDGSTTRKKSKSFCQDRFISRPVSHFKKDNCDEEKS